MAIRILLLALLLRVYPWTWVSGLPLPPEEQEAEVQAANGSAGATNSTVYVEAKVLVHSNRSASLGLSGHLNPLGVLGRLGHLPPTLSRTLRHFLFALSGCCGIVAICFLIRAYNFKVQSSKKYGLVASEDHLETGSLDSDEETVFEMQHRNTKKSSYHLHE
uniref:Uncharacterized protein n=1 Tax=Sarcophilus harrisii TaxID=9305 RepID=A0A7N4NN87_SARHA